MKRRDKYDFKMEFMSNESTLFPDAWVEILEQLNQITVRRVIGFNLKVLLAQKEKP